MSDHASSPHEAMVKQEAGANCCVSPPIKRARHSSGTSVSNGTHIPSIHSSTADLMNQQQQVQMMFQQALSLPQTVPPAFLAALCSLHNPLLFRGGPSGGGFSASPPQAEPLSLKLPTECTTSDDAVHMPSNGDLAHRSAPSSPRLDLEGGFSIEGESLLSRLPDQTNASHSYPWDAQFKALYEIDDDAERKKFLDELFDFMNKIGKPISRIPIMAKQTLDLYKLYKLVVAQGGLVEVINKKLWREITRGLDLPSSITSAAFTLRTQYTRYLYDFECARLHLSHPSMLKVAIAKNSRGSKSGNGEGEMSGERSPECLSRSHSLALDNHHGDSSQFYRTLAEAQRHNLLRHLATGMQLPIPPPASTSSPNGLCIADEECSANCSRDSTPPAKTDAVHSVVETVANGTGQAAHMRWNVDSKTVDGKEAKLVTLEIDSEIFQGILFKQNSAA